MLKLLLIATFTLGTFALAQAADKGDMQSSANDDWYNQHLSAAVQQFASVAAATAPEATAISESGTPLPASMASNINEDWYNQVLAREVEQFAREKAIATR